MADEYKNTSAPVGQGEKAQPIKLSCTNMASIAKQGPAYLRHLTAGSGDFLQNYVKTGSAADMALEESQRLERERYAAGKGKPQDVSASTAVGSIYARGDVLWDKKHRCKVTVLQSSGLGETESGATIYRVADRKGNSWRQSERNLERA